MDKKEKGFTLIELLVVIAIIGLLATVIFVSLDAGRIKARDAKRKIDLAQIRLAVEMYYDNKGYYPNPGGDWCHSNAACWDNLENELKAENLISLLPRDPKNNSTDYYGPFNEDSYSYVYIHRDDISPGQPYAYDLITRLENKNDIARCQLRCYKNATLDAQGTSFCPGGDGFPVCSDCVYIYNSVTQNELYSVRQ